MSGSFPVIVDVSSFDMQSEEKQHLTESISGVRQSRLVGAQRWNISVSLPLLTRVEFRAYWAFLVKQKGAHESFSFTIPELAQGALNGTPAFLSKTSDYEIVTDGWTNSITGQVKAGDHFTIAGDPKIYMVTDDANSNGSGQVTVKLYPALRIDPVQSDLLTFANVVATVSLSGGASYSRSGAFYQLSELKFREVLT